MDANLRTRKCRLSIALGVLAVFTAIRVAAPRYADPHKRKFSEFGGVTQ
jgi:hypothetical protein